MVPDLASQRKEGEPMSSVASSLWLGESNALWFCSKMRQRLSSALEGIELIVSMPNAA
jgi:hypothetical protein